MGSLVLGVGFGSTAPAARLTGLPGEVDEDEDEDESRNGEWRSAWHKCYRSGEVIRNATAGLKKTIVPCDRTCSKPESTKQFFDGSNKQALG